MRTRRAGLIILTLAAALATITKFAGQTEVTRRFDLVLEQKKGASFEVMEPTHVFNEGERIRFRLRSAVNGFLYVLNQGSSGKFVQLFPRDQLQQSREIVAGKDFLIPASGTGWFAIEGPPGFDTVYFIISPVDLGESLPRSPKQDEDTPSRAFATATPRCDDQLFKARGECLDLEAGVKPIQKGESLPDRIPQLSTDASRDLVVVKESKDTSISSTEPFDAPAIYRFRIAHR